MDFANKRISLTHRWLILAICLAGIIILWGGVSVSLATKPEQSIAKGVEYLIDEGAELNLEKARSLPPGYWTIEQSNTLNIGLVSDPVWFAFTLPADERARILSVDYAPLDDLQVWLFKDGVPSQHYTVGDIYPFHQRPINYERFAFDVEPSSTTVEVVMRVQTSGSMRMPVRLWSKEQFRVHMAERNLVMGLVFGFISAMMISNLFLFLTTRSFTFLSYCSYVLCTSLTLASLHGYGFKYLWPDWVWMEGHATGIFATAMVVSSLVFSIQLLQVRKHSLLLHKILKVAAYCYLAALIVSLFLSTFVYIRILLVILVIAIGLIFFTGVFLWHRGVRLARFYTLAWATLLSSGLLAALDNTDIITLPIASHDMIIFGATIETFLLALALALSYSQQRDDLFKTQTLALEREKQSRKVQEDIIRLKEESEQALEYKVQERTLELEIALRELSEKNQELEDKNTTDPLTGIRNRRFFDKKLVAEVRRSRRECTELSLVMLDIDNFKPINDTYGHMIGDECIRAVARFMSANLKRPSDDVCRYGGEEFALILPSTSITGAYRLVEEIRQAVEQNPVESTAGDINITVSAGICTMVIQSAEDEAIIVERADKALYKAKRNGRNQTICYDLDNQQSLDLE